MATGRRPSGTSRRVSSSANSGPAPPPGSPGWGTLRGTRGGRTPKEYDD